MRKGSLSNQLPQLSKQNYELTKKYQNLKCYQCGDVGHKTNEGMCG